MGHFLHSAKAFDVLERLDPDPEYWEGKRGACIGLFQQFIVAQSREKFDPNVSGSNSLSSSLDGVSGNGRVKVEDLQEVITMIRNTSNPQVEYITRVIKKWCKENNVKIN